MTDESKKLSESYTGGCLCGAVRFRIDEPMQSVLNCHCTFCRKTHGSAFATYGRLPRSSFHWLQGEETLGHYLSSPDFTRYFCSSCGSVMPIANPVSDSTFAFVPSGSLDDGGSAAPMLHIFTANKATWYSIPDALPQFEAWPGGVELAIAENLNREKLKVEISDNITTQEFTTETPKMTHGSCLCNRVTFSFKGPPQTMRNCHCSRCRKSRSAAHASNLFVTAEQFLWESGENLISRYKLPATDRFGVNFCSQCGSLVPRPIEKFEIVNIPAGCLDDDPGMSPVMHIFTASKAPWFDIVDSLPRYDTYPTQPDPVQAGSA